MARPKSFASMSVDQLLALRESLDKFLQHKRDQLERSLRELGRITGMSGGEKKGRRGPHPAKGRKVPPKFRNPDNPSDSWAGRGAQPRWLKAHLNAGRKIEEFAVSGRNSAPKKRGRKPGTKSRKAA
jgi:DNA-binding protein H-NS